VLLIGASGNLGNLIEKFLHGLGHQVYKGVRIQNSPQDILIKEFQKISIPKHVQIDLIINASNKYFVNENSQEIDLMHNTIIGITSSIIQTNIGCPVIFFSTYLQYLEASSQPWSIYTDFKTRSAEMMMRYSKDTSISVLELVLYDNYGGQRQNKFFDLAIDSVSTGKKLLATPGDSILNLTYIWDIINSLTDTLNNNLNSLNQGNLITFSIYSKDTYTLKDLVSIIERVSGKTVPVHWGAQPYRSKEVFEFTPAVPIFPAFVQSKSIIEYISTKLL
jgi:nucleoside-diphosphate-sugar epimerase